MYAPVNPFVAISHLVFSGIVSIVLAIDHLLCGYFFVSCPSLSSFSRGARRIRFAMNAHIVHGASPASARRNAPICQGKAPSFTVSWRFDAGIGSERAVHAMRRSRYANPAIAAAAVHEVLLR
jgi:hypothetical protein